MADFRISYKIGNMSIVCLFASLCYSVIMYASLCVCVGDDGVCACVCVCTCVHVEAKGPCSVTSLILFTFFLR